MNKHPYLRAYLAGIATPTVFLLVAMSGYTIWRYVVNIPVPIERMIVFPMAMVPNLWGLWNVLYLKLRQRRKISLGLFGAILVLLIAPLGYLLTRVLSFEIPRVVLMALPVNLVVGAVLYYLLWKHIVGFLNAELGIA
ncbi:MAG TPA: hypothetical protein VMU53_08835 [Candidatus Sulfotelmatobacter sp.]|nr:hypothetical protein [Candidatus Sulfotelmatobacter sp.]